MSIPGIFVIGDSISVHYGPYLERALGEACRYARKQGVAEAARDLDHPRGANGGDSNRVLAFMRELDLTGGLDVDLLLVNCGLHDIKRRSGDRALQVGLDDYVANLHAIVALVASWRTRLVWLRSTPVDESTHNDPTTSKRSFHRLEADLAAYNQAADGVMAASGVEMIDFHGFTLGLGPDLYCDHVHFTEPVRRQQGAFLAGWVLGRLQHSQDRP